MSLKNPVRKQAFHPDNRAQDFLFAEPKQEMVASKPSLLSQHSWDKHNAKVPASKLNYDTHVTTAKKKMEYSPKKICAEFPLQTGWLPTLLIGKAFPRQGETDNEGFLKKK